MRDPYSVYKSNLESYRSLEIIYKYFNEKVSVMDASDVLRAYYVLAVSAFDCYIHDLVKKGMQEIFNGTRQGNRQFDSYQINLTQLKTILAQDETIRSEQLGHIIADINSKDSYQSPKSIEYALGLISYSSIWTSIAQQIGGTAEDVKDRLAIIIRRRNQIAHEADLKDKISEEKNDISLLDIEDVILFLNQMVDSINTMYSDKEIS